MNIYDIFPKNSSRTPGLLLLLPLLGLEAHLCLGRDRERRRPEMWASGHIYISMWAWVRPCCVTFNGSCVFIMSPKGSSHNPNWGIYESTTAAGFNISSIMPSTFSWIVPKRSWKAPKNLKTSQILLSNI